jgi:hypothetical protein
MKRIFLALVLIVPGLFTLQSCGAGSVAASALGVGADCTSNSNCNEVLALTCLTEFKGGYCGKANCTSNAGCPVGSVCVTEAGVNYCFLVCTDKTECNLNRSADNESNCSNTDVVKVEAGDDKVCVPPSGA